MQLRRRRRAAVLAIAVVTGMLGTAPAAVAAPPPPDSTTSPTTPTSPAPRTDAAAPTVWPRPQSMRHTGTPARVTEETVLITDGSADPYTVEALRALLRSAGARRIAMLRDTDPRPPGALAVRASAERPGRDTHHTLPTGGYGLTVAPGTVTLSGAGEDGLFHAVQTLRQLITPGTPTIAGAEIRDWPGTAVRGTTEGFYGEPWTHEQRLAHLDFMGRTKQNRYLYAPGDDLRRQARWREPYPAERRAEFRELAERARRNHVTLAWAVAPGQSMCLSSDADVAALNRKLDAMWALGFRAFQLQFQDVSYSEWHCEADADRFGSGPEAAARAHARVADAVARHLAKHHPGSTALSLMPTEYYQDGTTPYRRTLARELDPDVEVAWTGVGVVPRTITGGELTATREAFGHPLVTMDNYPVNDYAQDRLFLGPYTGRHPAVAAGSAGLLAHAMQQAAASRIPLFTAADYAWNPRAYAPEESWRAAIADLAAGDAHQEQALAALAGNDASSVLDDEESAYLRPLLEAYWRTRLAPETQATDRLRTAFTVMRETPDRLSRTPLATETAPWTSQLARYGEAGVTALDMLDAQRRGDTATAWTSYRTLDRLRTRIDAAPVTVGKGVLDPFLTRAQKSYESWAGLTREPNRPPDGRTLHFPRPRPLSTVTALTDPGTTGTVEAHVPGKGWQGLGPLTPSGATELPTTLHADAVRVTGPSPSRIHHLIPWYADTPPAELTLNDHHEEPTTETGSTLR
ncbi:beta-N-acetylglucosaminidase domain-containing protein, partial [Streptomyces sp. B93]|uniref:beta-N-acetylglucosaminidase domain-containing protein n=1 Tax=Streptomyces sp. B93 TaxID=2824875 RepID=UPI001B388F31